jgi:hypothetical protein
LLIVLSSVTTWGATSVPPPAVALPDSSLKLDADAAEIDDREEPPEPVSDTMEWHMKREPLPMAADLREFERQVIAARKRNVRVMIVTLGALYGHSGLCFGPVLKVV